MNTKQKLFVLAIIIVIVLLVVPFGYSNMYKVEEVTYDIYLNGQKWVPENLVLSLNDRTYLPLRELAELLDVKINWNEELRRVEIGENIEWKENNEDVYSIDNPCPVYETCRYLKDGYVLDIQIKDVIYGEYAYDIVEESKTVWNYELEEGNMYVLTEVEVELIKAPIGMNMDMDRFDFVCFSEDNIQYSQKFIEIPDGLSGKIYEGGSITGYLAYEVKEEDNPKIGYGLTNINEDGIWLNIF